MRQVVYIVDIVHVGEGEDITYFTVYILKESSTLRELYVIKFTTKLVY